MEYVLADFDMEQATGLIVAVVLGALIGLEREFRRHPAGLHTNALVALGAAAYVIAGTAMGDDTAPARIVGQIVVGIGFMGAGLIWHKNGTVSGINTAATVWCSCAVGVFCGFGFIAWALFVAILVVLANVVLHALEKRISGTQ
jgi:putative Mg2+ transporter-C (MgtC) family protein